MSETIIDLIRHGEPQGGPMYRGSTDDPLSSTGWQQMRDVTSAQQPWQQIISSPLLRCVEFAKEVAVNNDIDLLIDEGLQEVGFGEWEGKTATQLEEIDKEAFFAFHDDPVANTPPGGESMLLFQGRVISAWQHLLSEYQGKHVLLVAHGGVNRVIMSHVLGMPLAAMFRIVVPYACITRIKVFPSGYAQLISHSAAL